VTQHPAHQLARMAADAAEELRGYTDPADPFPWELTEADHRAILPRLHHAIAHLAICIDGIAQATGHEHAKRELAEGVGRLLSGCAYVGAAGAILSLPGGEPDAEPAITPQPAHEPDEQDDAPGEEQETMTQPARLSAADFPAVMTAGVLQAASSPPAPASGPAVSPAARARASRPHPGR
jgi:hypothetical protein